jgi:hypothetical protein
MSHLEKEAMRSLHPNIISISDLSCFLLFLNIKNSAKEKVPSTKAQGSRHA